MFVSNYYKIFAMNFSGVNLSNGVTQGGGQSGIYKTGSYWGDVFGIKNSSYGLRFELVSKLDGGSAGVAFGTGTAPVTFNDYKLSGDYISGLTASITQNAGSDDDGVWKTALYTLTNSNDYDVTIGEVGSFITCCSSTSTQATSRYSALVERTVLSSPVTIPAGGIGQVTYTLRFNYPTA